MLLSKKVAHFKQKCGSRLLEDHQCPVDWSSSPGVFWATTRHSLCVPEPYVGVLNGAVKFSNTFQNYCFRQRRVGYGLPHPSFGSAQFITNPKPHVIPELSNVLQEMMSQATGTSSNSLELKVAQDTLSLFTDGPQLKSMTLFLSNIVTYFHTTHLKHQVFLEPFQKQLILHSFFFIASIKFPETVFKMYNQTKELFGLLHTNESIMTTFQQKATVFLIPRRHGKTWIVVAIISMLLCSIDNIHIGYVAHQKHVSMAVFLEVISILQSRFAKDLVDIKKENGLIIFKHTGGSSTLMCATCFNKNVSTSFLFFCTQ
ncbi:cleavage/packaging protein [Cricetid gammaherpesvirus 2]|uniref:Cleavage/packaging protein n=1 Tax=Cricetid gammaherpesvirus 2 TaxID=1605972 RepID=E9M5L7_9GAMA|nr:cleavage/packaging protein [Cricetid gammaherpesvirus 2]ADW24375.1 cleavage/packaging protein [Cricetid gammaherpesvirus 2]ADW24457.1 cleavage/packaging protein [Cricetid gammaherpesvirus 2]